MIPGWKNWSYYVAILFVTVALRETTQEMPYCSWCHNSTSWAVVEVRRLPWKANCRKQEPNFLILFDHFRVDSKTTHHSGLAGVPWRRVLCLSKRAMLPFYVGWRDCARQKGLSNMTQNMTHLCCQQRFHLTSHFGEVDGISPSNFHVSSFGEIPPS